MDYDVFNGDADGICALLQLRLNEARKAQLVTGVKRDIQLLSQVQAKAGDRITVLDISMDKNKAALQSCLASGAEVLYADHHVPGEIPKHPQLTALIDESPQMCTAAIINEHLRGQQVLWAITGAFGDNLRDTAQRLAAPLVLSDPDLNALEALGVAINYNGYGPSLADLHFEPAALYQSLYDSANPLAFVRESADYQTLSAGYQDDMLKAGELKAHIAKEKTAVFMLPDLPWARRVSGVFGNDLASKYPQRAHAVLTEKDSGSYLVSVRAPLSDRRGAADLCGAFPSGGGRAGAAGINDLPADQLGAFLQAFDEQYA